MWIDLACFYKNIIMFSLFVNVCIFKQEEDEYSELDSSGSVKKLTKRVSLKQMFVDTKPHLWFYK